MLRQPSRVERRPAADLHRVIGQRRPIILEGLLVDQPRLTLRELERSWGDRVVPVAPIVDGVGVYSAEGGIAFREVTVRDYVHGLENGGAGLLTARPQDFLPGVTDRLPVFDPGPRAAWRRSRIWVAPANTVTPLHHEVTSNLLAQLEGDKVVTLYSPWEYRAMYPHRPWSRMPQMSRVAANAPDLTAQPRFAQAKPWVADLRATDVLYIPAFWWHWVVTKHVSLSYNLWFAGGIIGFLARSLERYKAMRALRF